MSNIIRRTKLIEITKLIADMKKDNICLPDFQRDFVWKPEQMAKLIESVVRQYPTGTFMFLSRECNPSFGVRSFNNPDEENLNPKDYVIDGQQRLKTFQLTLSRPKKFKPLAPFENRDKLYKLYFRINIDKHNFSPDVDKPSFIVVERTEEDEVTDYKEQGMKRLIPLEFVMDEDYIDLWFELALPNRSKDKIKKYRNNILYVKNSIENYKCVIERVENKIQPRDHYNIFQLLNSEGTDLTLFDLMVAKLHPLHINLRKLWKESLETYPNFAKKSYDLDPIYILKVISIIRATKNEIKDKENSYFGCSQSDLKKLYRLYENLKKGKEEFENDWDDACKFINKTIDEMKSRYGVCGKKYVPYSPMIVTFASIKWWFDDNYEQRFKPTMQEKMDKWYWGSIMDRTYRASTDNVIKTHYLALRRWIVPKGNKNIPTEINFKFSMKEIENSFDGIDSSADARYKAIICIPLIKNATDIYSDEILVDSDLHDHHIYTKKFLKDKGYDYENNKKDRKKINKLGNRMLITAKTNEEIQGGSPYDYLKKAKKYLAKHFLFREIYTEKMDFKNFLDKRNSKICNFLFDKLK